MRERIVGPFAYLCLYVALSCPSASGQKPELVVQTGQADFMCVAISPDARTLASGSMDKSIKLWEVATGRQLRSFAGHTGRVFAVTFSPDGSILASGSEDGTARLWDVNTGRNLQTLKGHRQTVSAVSFSLDGRMLASGGYDNTIKLWDVTSGRELRTLKGHANSVISVVFGRDSLTLVSGSEDKTIVLWDLATGRKLRTLVRRNRILKSLVFSPDGRIVASAYKMDNTVKLLDVTTGRELRTLRGHTRPVDSLAFSSDGRILASGDEAGTIRLWDVNGGQQLRTLTGYLCCVSSLTLTRRILASVGDMGKLLLWDVSTGEGLRELRGFTSSVWSVAFNPSGQILATGNSDSTIKLWDVATGRGLRNLTGHVGVVFSVAFSLDGHNLASGGWDEMIKLWDVAHGRELRTLKVRTGGPINSVAFSPDGRTLASAASYNTIRVWNVTTGRVVRSLVTHTKRSDRPDGVVDSPVAFSSNGEVLASAASGDATIMLWDMTGVGKSKILHSHTGPVDSLNFSPDGRTLASGSEDGTARLWNVNTGAEVRTLKGHTQTVTSVAFSPDGCILASASEDGTINIWDVATGRHLRNLAGHSRDVNSVAFSPEGRILASASTDESVKLWDVTTGEELGSLFALEGTSDWFVSDVVGRFDASNLDDFKGLSWVFPDEPLRALPPEIFMRNYYEPRLLPRLLAREEISRVRPLQDLNRVQPVVNKVSVRPGASADVAEVTVEVSPAEERFQRDGKGVTIKTDVYDLRLFRSGQLVGQEPELSPEAEASLKNGVELTPEQVQAWRDARRVKLDRATGTALKTFSVRLPHGMAGKEIEFTAYAFNEDRVKSETARASYKVPADVGPVHKRAYLITMGVNAYENERWDLHFAANDAGQIQEALGQRLAGYEVVPVSLISDCQTAECPENGDRTIRGSHATKAALHAVLEKLAGHELSEELKKSLPPEGEKVEKAEPDDLVVMFVSSHGYTSREGTFYIVPSDSGDTEGHTLRSELLQKWISSDELSGWLRDVDAGDLVMIVDTCHSAATVDEPGFKPGPMGSRGLGQLAYDKGMRILAASQADDVALEVEKLKQGLLTYALVQNGLEDGQAAADGKITMDRWLQYGVDRVPVLYEEVLSGKVQKATDASKDTDIDVELSGGSSSLKRPNAFQQPSFFNFQKRATDILLEK